MLQWMKNLLSLYFWRTGGVWRRGMQQVHQACLGGSLPRNGVLTSCPPSTPLHWQWNHDRMEWHREAAGTCWRYTWSRLCGHCVKVSFHKWGCIHRLLWKCCPKVCYTSVWQSDTYIQDNKEYWMHPLFLHVKLRHFSMHCTTSLFSAGKKLQLSVWMVWCCLPLFPA
jgi:hypothetical protein